MSKLSAAGCLKARPNPGGGDRLLGDGDGLYLRIRPSGTKTWFIEYEFNKQRRTYTIGAFDGAGSSGESIPTWLEHARLSLKQARAIAGHWKAERHAGRDPIQEWEAKLTAQREAKAAAEKA